jgi:multidrug efflux pump
MLNNLIDLAINKWRSTFFIIFLLFVFGINGYVKIPKESSPEVVFPVVSVSVSYRGVSPEDGERMIIKPLENHLS